MVKLVQNCTKIVHIKYKLLQCARFLQNSTKVMQDEIVLEFYILSTFEIKILKYVQLHKVFQFLLIILKILFQNSRNA